MSRFSNGRIITPKVRKAELSFLYVTRRLVLFNISAKYHQNIPKGIQVTERTQIFFKQKGNNSKIGDNSDKKKIQVTYFLVRNQNMKFQNISIHGS